MIEEATLIFVSPAAGEVAVMPNSLAAKTAGVPIPTDEDTDPKTKSPARMSAAKMEIFLFMQ
ncbi:hypothetical protein D3C73_1671010 [compost metagenome]